MPIILTRLIPCGVDPLTRPVGITSYSYLGAFIAIMRLRKLLIKTYNDEISLMSGTDTTGVRYAMVYSGNTRIMQIHIGELDTKVSLFTRIRKFLKSVIIDDTTQIQ